MSGDPLDDLPLTLRIIIETSVTTVRTLRRMAEVADQHPKRTAKEALLAAAESFEHGHQELVRAYRNKETPQP